MHNALRRKSFNLVPEKKKIVKYKHTQKYIPLNYGVGGLDKLRTIYARLSNPKTFLPKMGKLTKSK